MKKVLVFAALIISLSASGQKKDTTIQITVSIDQLRALLLMIDQNVDSKKVSKELIDFLQKNAQILQPAIKPKQ